MSNLPARPFEVPEYIRDFNDSGPRPKVYSSVVPTLRCVAADLRDVGETEGVTFLALDTEKLEALLESFLGADSHVTAELALELPGTLTARRATQLRG